MTHDTMTKQKQQHDSSPRPGSRRTQHTSSSMHPMFRSVSMLLEPTTTTTATRFVGDTTVESSHCNSPTTPTPIHNSFRKSQSCPGALPDPHTNPSAPHIWNVKHLHNVPYYYPMETSAITLQPDSLASLTKQITDFMKERSIASVYHDQAGRADCLTSNLVHFSVHLWKGNNKVGDDDGGRPKVIVEIQRRKGCCIEMQRLRQDLIHHLIYPSNTPVAESTTNVTAVHTHNTPTTTLSPPTTSVQFLSNLVDQTARTARQPLPAFTMTDGDNAYQLCLRLLQSTRLDECSLGLESLCVLADRRKVMRHQAYYVASKILTDTELQSLLMDYFANVEVQSSERGAGDCGLQSKDLDDDDDNQDRTLDYSRGHFFGAMHIFALKVVSNALDTAAYFAQQTKSTENELIGSIMNLSSPFWNHVLQALVYNMHLSHVRPLEACISIHCLRRLHFLFPEAWKEHPTISAENRGARLDHSLFFARFFGRTHYWQLERETQEFMTQLGLAY